MSEPLTGLTPDTDYGWQTCVADREDLPRTFCSNRQAFTTRPQALDHGSMSRSEIPLHRSVGPAVLSGALLHLSAWGRRRGRAREPRSERRRQHGPHPAGPRLGERPHEASTTPIRTRRWRPSTSAPTTYNSISGVTRSGSTFHLTRRQRPLPGSNATSRSRWTRSTRRSQQEHRARATARVRVLQPVVRPPESALADRGRTRRACVAWLRPQAHSAPLPGTGSASMTGSPASRRPTMPVWWMPYPPFIGHGDDYFFDVIDPTESATKSTADLFAPAFRAASPTRSGVDSALRSSNATPATASPMPRSTRRGAGVLAA